MTKKAFLSMQTILIILMGLSVLCNKAAENSGKKQKSETTLTGVIMKTGTDESGNVASVSIDVESEDSYEYYDIIMDEKGRELTRQVDNTVKITGFVQEDIVKKKSIQVTSWELIKEKSATPGNK